MFGDGSASVKAMHAQRPLQADDRAFHRLQERERKAQDQGNPEHEMDCVVGPERRLDGESEGHDNVTDDGDHHISRHVVGAVMVQVLATGGTGFGDLQEAAK